MKPEQHSLKKRLPISFSNIPTSSALFLITFYQKVFSFGGGFLGFLFNKKSVCVFYPSCSAYAKEALIRFGFWKGLVLAARRVIRCHPWQEPKVDEVPEK